MAEKKLGDTTNTGADAPGQAPITIKKYANRRLYNTATSSYVTLDHLCQMVKDNVDFVVYDAKSGEDITRSVLTQIIVEEEAKTGQNLLPINFLRQLIGFYGDNMQQMLLPHYLEMSIRSFADNQEKMQNYMRDSLGSVFPFGEQLGEMGRQNLAMFEKAMQLFSPFTNPLQGNPSQNQAKQDVDSLKAEMAALQAKLDKMTRG